MSDDFDIRKLGIELELQSQPVQPTPERIQVRCNIINSNGMVKIIFSEPIPYMNMTKTDAKQFAARLIKAALK